VTVPLGPAELVRRAAQLRELLASKRLSMAWADYQLDALVQRVREVEDAARALDTKANRSLTEQEQGMRIKFKQTAPRGAVFHPEVFASQIGKVLPFSKPGMDQTECTVVGAVVAEDGRSAELELDIPDGSMDTAPFLNGVSLEDPPR
jgi:hypothetical protein